MVSQPSYATLVTGLEPAQTGKMTSTLDQQGISYELQNNGTALAVQSDETARGARRARRRRTARQHPAGLLAV